MARLEIKDGEGRGGVGGDALSKVGLHHVYCRGGMHAPGGVGEGEGVEKGVRALVVPQPDRVVRRGAEHVGEVRVEGKRPNGVSMSVELAKVVVHSNSMPVVGVKRGGWEVPHAHQAICSCSEHSPPISSQGERVYRTSMATEGVDWLQFRDGGFVD